MTNRSYQNHKEMEPEATVHLIRNFLSELGVLLTEKWQNSTTNSYSLRLLDSKTGSSVNGKGTTPSFALASAYAEYMERLQNMLLYPVFQLTHEVIWHGGFFIAPDEVQYSVDELVKRGDAFTMKVINDYLFSAGNNAEYEELIDLLIYDEDSSDSDEVSSHTIKRYTTALTEWSYATFDSNTPRVYTCVPYYSIKNREIQYLPEGIVRQTHGSNGMCAGNTPDEALVQGLSEVLERYTAARVMEEGTIPPEIPRSELKKYPEILLLIEELESKGNFIITNRDCSLGREIPVVMSILIDQEHETYHANYGSHPDFPVAVERSLTELVQGFDLADHIARERYMLPLIRNTPFALSNWYNSLNQSLNSKGVLLPRFFAKSSSYNYKPWEDRSRYSNKELLKFEINLVLSLGSDIFIRDVAFAGFPAYKIVVPGISHMPVDKNLLSSLVCRNETSSLLQKKVLTNRSELNHLLKAVMHSMSITVTDGCLPGVYDPELAIALLLRLDKVHESVAFANILEKGENNQDKKRYYSCLKTYLLAKSDSGTDEECSNLTQLFYGKELSQRVISDWFTSDPVNLLKKRAVKPGVNYLNTSSILHTKLKELQLNNPINQQRIENIVRDYAT